MTTQPATETLVQPEVLETPLPSAWIGPEDDYDAEQRLGRWVDMAGPPQEVIATVRGIVEAAPPTSAQRFAVCELRDFAGWQPSEHEGLPVVMRVARGIAKHGPAFAALASRLGADSTALRSDKFPLSFIGDWPSLRHFAETVAQESGWYERLAALPANLQRYVRLDIDAVMADASHELTVIDHPAGVWVYDPRLW